MRITRRAIWVLAAAVLLGFPIFHFLYWTALAGAGRLRPDADSISLPIGLSMILAVLASPVVIGATWLCLRRLGPDTTWMAWRRDRLVRSWGGALLLGGAALFLVAVALGDAIRGIDRPWFDHLWNGYALILAAWLLGLRAALAGQQKARAVARG
ncbi:hypothetical protein [Pseudoroseomonas sp. WGS1072]|uniref:hypothetical protein n=1 Tax=Roseomonas sp. WGS1072 TaxID=3366816 RepID=UPI003BF2AF53